MKIIPSCIFNLAVIQEEKSEISRGSRIQVNPSNSWWDMWWHHHLWSHANSINSKSPSFKCLNANKKKERKKKQVKSSSDSQQAVISAPENRNIYCRKVPISTQWSIRYWVLWCEASGFRLYFRCPHSGSETGTSWWGAILLLSFMCPRNAEWGQRRVDKYTGNYTDQTVPGHKNQCRYDQFFSPALHFLSDIIYQHF